MLSNLLGSSESKYSSITSALSIGASCIGGGIIGGFSGAVTGFCSSLIDEFLIQKKIEDKHLITESLFWSSFAITPFSTYYYPQLSEKVKWSICGLSSFALSYFLDDFLDFKPKLNTPLESISLLNRFFTSPNKDPLNTQTTKTLTGQIKSLGQKIKETYQHPFFNKAGKITTLALASIAINHYFLKVLGVYSNALFSYAFNKEYLEQHGLDSVNSSDYYLSGAKIASIILSKSLFSLIQQSARQYLSVDLMMSLFDESITLFHKGNNGRKIMNEQQGNSIGNNLVQDIATLVNDAEKGLDLTKDLLHTALSLQVLREYSPSLIAPYLFTLLPLQIFYKYLCKKITEVKKKYMANKTQFYEFNWVALNCIENIKLRDACFYFSKKLTRIGQLDQQLTSQEKVVQILKNESPIWISSIHHFLDLGFLAYPLSQGSLSFTHLPQVKDALNQLFSFFSSNLTSQMNQTDLKLSKARVEALFEIIAKPSSQSADRFYTSDTSLKVENYELYLHQDKLLQIDSLEFEPTKTYAFMGPSGCGKSSFLTDLKIGLLEPFSNRGTISLPLKDKQPAKIFFLNQNLFFPPQVTLIEGILFPKILEELPQGELKEYKELVLHLFYELEMNPSSESRDSDSLLACKLDSNEYRLSGGQIKKIGLIQAILNKPDILIMDEVFAGLDRESIIRCQIALKKYLPNTLMIVVDHNAKENNDLDFYDYCVDFSDRTAQIAPL